MIDLEFIEKTVTHIIAITGKKPTKLKLHPRLLDELSQSFYPRVRNVKGGATDLKKGQIAAVTTTGAKLRIEEAQPHEGFICFE